MQLSETLRKKRLEDCTPDEVRKRLAYSFARQALAEGLDTKMRRDTWQEAGRRLFGGSFDESIAMHLHGELRDLTDVGSTYTLNELAQALSMLGPTDWCATERKFFIERIMDRAPGGWLRAPPQRCPVIGIQVTKVWRRTA